LIIQMISVFTFAQNLTINFESGKSNLDKQSKADLTNFILENKPTELILEGYADTIGTNYYNQKLVQQRLVSVECFLLELDKSITIKKENFGEEKSFSNDIEFRKVDVLIPQAKYQVKKPKYKTPQSFVIDNMKDTIIVCEKGTKIEIPRNCLIVKRDKSNPKGLINLQVTEYYEVPEMIEAGLTTQSGSKILETGGMLYIQAFSDDDECVIDNKASIGLKFKDITERDSMHIFTGNKTDNGIDWELENNANILEIVDRKYFIVEDMPTFLGGNSGAFRAYVSSKLRYPVILQEKGIQGSVVVNFIIDESGKIKNPKILKSPHPAFNYEVLRVLSSTPAWNPGKHDGKAVSVQMTVPFNFVLYGGLPVDENNRINSDFDYETLINNDSIKEYDEVQGEFYNEFFLRTTKLGWINCDRFYNYQLKRDIKILAKSMYDNYYAVFNNKRSIMSPNSFNGKLKVIGFNNIPVNQKTLIIGFKFTNDEAFFTSFEAEPDKDIYNPQFEKMDKEEFVKKMNELGL